MVICTLGVGWLLSALGIGQNIDWVWTLCLGVVAILIILLSGGIDKVSIVLSPVLLVGSLLSVLRQSGRLSIDVEMPILVIVFGLSILISQLPQIPLPRWLDLPTAKRNQA